MTPKVLKPLLLAFVASILTSTGVEAGLMVTGLDSSMSSLESGPSFVLVDAIGDKERGPRFTSPNANEGMSHAVAFERGVVVMSAMGSADVTFVVVTTAQRLVVTEDLLQPKPFDWGVSKVPISMLVL